MGTYKQFVCKEHLNEVVEQGVYTSSNRVVSIGFADEPKVIHIADWKNFNHSKYRFYKAKQDKETVVFPICTVCRNYANYNVTWHEGKHKHHKTDEAYELNFDAKLINLPSPEWGDKVKDQIILAAIIFRKQLENIEYVEHVTVKGRSVGCSGKLEDFEVKKGTPVFPVEV